MGNAAAKQRAGGRNVHWDTAVPPAPPGKPHLVPGSPHTQPDLVIIRWDPPINDGGSPVTGYLVEHRRTGSPHWVRATAQLLPTAELLLSGLEPGWRYQFRVSAMNDVGLSEPGDVSEPLTVALNRSTTSAPYFLQELRDAVTIENETAEFHVVFRGTPAPKIAWYKDGFEIFSSRRMRIVTEGDKSSLVIFQTAFSDEGDIKCTATNRVGHVVSKAKLRLEAPPRVRLPRRYEEGLLFEKGEVIRLKVSVAGRPLPRVSWLHNGEPVPFGGRYDVTHTEKGSALRVADARRADRGEYAVRASSRLGDDTAAFLVTVTDRPMPPGRAQLKGANDRWVDLEWTEPDDDGGCKIGNYIVEYYRIGWNVWLKAATSRQLSTRLEDLIEGSEYKFRVKAENPYGVSDPGEESDVVFVPDPRRGLMEPPARKSATLPANVTLNQKLEPLPQTVVEINKNKSIERKPLMPIGNQDTTDMRKRKDFTDDAPPPIPPKSVKKTKGPQPPQRHQKSATLPAQLPTPPAIPQTQQKIEEFQQPSWTNKKLLNPASPLTPREEDDSILHGSSELMLVLLPEGEGEGVQKEKGGGEPQGPAPPFGAEGDGAEESVPPPMSLSAPELGSGDALMSAPLRNAVSSSELLHERAMARFYQSVAAEEAQKAMQRRHSLGTPAAPAVPAPLPSAVEDRRRPATPPLSTAAKEPPLPQPMEEDSTDAMEDYDVEVEEPYEDSLEEDEDLLEMGVPEPPPFRARLSFEEDAEEETYHPRAMTGVRRRSLTPERELSPPPPIPPHARAPPPARSPPPPPPPTAFVPKPILKKPRSPSPPQARSPLPHSPSPSPSPSPRPSRSPAARSPPPRSPSPPSAYPGLELPERPQSPGVGPPRRPPSRQEMQEEQQALAQALDDHYGGIIRDVSRSHRPPKRLFTNTAELKAAVEHQPRPLFDPKARATPVPQPPPPKKEPTPQPEEPPPPKKSRRWWSWFFGGDDDDEEEEEVLDEEEATPAAATAAAPAAAAAIATAAKGSPAPAEASPSPAPAQRPATPTEDTAKVAEKKARTSLEYLTDLSLFTVAFWLYVFGDELLAIPILLLMVYRQLREAISNRLPKFMRPS